MIAGRYDLEREIGRGGMGAVWLARDQVLGRTVAVKRIGTGPGGSSPDLERAEREARLAARLNHPHVVAVFDLVLEEGHRWLVMEYVAGETLAARVAREGALPPDQAAAVLVQAADALAAAHTAGIVHRDVKPSNILVTPDGQAKLTDFGIARAEADATLTQTGLVTGSPAYLAPEVASGATATPESDVWSLGATLFHALAGKPPYDTAGNLIGALYRIVHEDPPRLPDAGWLAPVLEATMTRDPAARWSMREVRDFLARPPATAATRVIADPDATAPLGRVPTAATPPLAASASGSGSASVDGPEAASAGAVVAPPRADSPRRRRSPLPWLVGLLLVVVALLVWALLRTDDPARTVGTERSPSADASASEESPTEEAGPTEEGMTAFVQSYLSTVTSDPAAAFKDLAPRFQRESGGLEGYRGFWDDVDTAAVRDVSADSENMTVSYTVDYTMTDGNRVTDDVRLTLSYEDGSYLITGEG